MFAGVALSSALVLASLASPVNAHGYLKEPKPSWVSQPNPGWIALVDNYWDIGSGGDQCGKFKTTAAQKGMSVKDVVLDMVKGEKCGNTLENGTPQPIPSDGKAKWLGNGGGGFTHVGPCEVYLDDKLVLHGDNCEEEYKGGGVGSTETSDMPVDYSSCNGKCTLSFYWLAFQNEQWRVCVGSSTSTQSTPTTQVSSPEEQTNKTKSKEEHKSGENRSNEAHKTQAPSTKQEPTQAPWTQAPSTQWAQSQTTQTPSKEQHYVSFSNLNGGTGTVQPSNLHQ